MGRIERHETSMSEKIDKLSQEVRAANVTMATHIAKEEALDYGREKLLVDMQHTIWGNGKEGLDKRTDRVEQWQGRMRWAFTSVIVPLVIYACYVIMQRYMKA